MDIVLKDKRSAHIVKRMIGILLCICITMIGLPNMSSYAATGDITSLRISYSELAAADMASGTFNLPVISASGSVDCSVSWSDNSTYKPGADIRGTITITADDGYTLSLSKSKVTSYSKLTISSVTRKSDTEYEIDFKYGPLLYKLDSPQNVDWKNSSNGKLEWDKVEYAKSYKVEVFVNGKSVHTETVTGRTYDATKYFASGEDVDVTVVASASGSTTSSYTLNSEPVHAGEQSLDDEETSIYGTWEGNRYRISDDEDDQKEYASGWLSILGNWYYFNSSGSVQKGWITLDNKKYYLDKDSGSMITGWKKIDNKWYYMLSSGEMATGWTQTSPDHWYYLSDDGSMFVGWISMNGRWYFLGLDGRMISGWKEINGIWYYFYPDGHMASGEYIDRYYVNSDGAWVN